MKPLSLMMMRRLTGKLSCPIQNPRHENIVWKTLKKCDELELKIAHQSKDCSNLRTEVIVVPVPSAGEPG